MAFKREQKDACALLKIEGAMTINEAAGIRDELLECLDTYDGLTVDLNAVSACDAAGIQLLCASRVTAHSDGKSFGLTGVSDALMDAFARAGVNMKEILGDALTQ